MTRKAQKATLNHELESARIAANATIEAAKAQAAATRWSSVAGGTFAISAAVAVAIVTGVFARTGATVAALPTSPIGSSASAPATPAVVDTRRLATSIDDAGASAKQAAAELNALQITMQIRAIDCGKYSGEARDNCEVHKLSQLQNAELYLARIQSTSDGHVKLIAN